MNLFSKFGLNGLLMIWQYNGSMKELDLKALLPAVEEIARQAGAEIMKHYAGTGVYTKSDGSEVTDADHAAENLILPALKALTPQIPIVSEERVAAGEVPDISGGTFWTVDPLDGTSEFINKTGAFVVAIALIVDNQAVMGIIYHPTQGLMYSGMGPGTATKTGSDGIRLPLTVNETVTEQMRVLVKSNANIDGIKGYLTKQFDKAAHIDTMGGAVLTNRVAENMADMAVVYPLRRNGRTYWWDVAPGHAIVESAGGKVETLEGQPLRYDAADLQVPPHVILSPRQVQPSTQNKPPKIS
jgi:3'(2'), 5'-bisphosphate nucleotidase